MSHQVNPSPDTAPAPHFTRPTCGPGSAKDILLKEDQYIYVCGMFQRLRVEMRKNSESLESKVANRINLCETDARLNAAKTVHMKERGAAVAGRAV